MTRTNLAVNLGGRFAVLCVVLAASAALAQTPAPSAVLPPVVPGTTAADVAPAPDPPRSIPRPARPDPERSQDQLKATYPALAAG